jgi:hypothetical protein
MSENRRWNIFARVLEDLLTARHLSWQALYEQAGIEQDIVDQLQASLLSLSAFPILTIEEMDDVIDVFDMTSDETLQLRAALIATEVERILMECIEDQAALQASEQVFATTLDDLRKQKAEKHGFGGYKGDRELEAFFKKVNKYIEAGTSARQRSRSASEEVRVRYLREALYHFEQASVLLERESMSQIGSTRHWNASYQRVQGEYNQIRRELQALEH